MLRSLRIRLGWLALAISTILHAHAADAGVVVSYAQRTIVDTDGDTVPDLVDNAPGVPNNQADTDADGIGDAIDNDPATTPFLGNLFLGMSDAPPIAPGGTAVFDYLMMFNPPNPITPPGDYGYIDLDFGGNGVFDATYFGPLTTTTNQIAVTASLFVDGSWNLNAPGTYTVHALAFGPAMHSQAVTITSVTVEAVPESTHLVLAAGVIAAAMQCQRTLRRRLWKNA